MLFVVVVSLPSFAPRVLIFQFAGAPPPPSSLYSRYQAPGVVVSGELFHSGTAALRLSAGTKQGTPLIAVTFFSVVFRHLLGYLALARE